MAQDMGEFRRDGDRWVHPGIWAVLVDDGIGSIPELCPSEEIAKARALTLSRETPGCKVHLLQCFSAGWVETVQKFHGAMAVEVRALNTIRLVRE